MGQFEKATRTRPRVVGLIAALALLGVAGCGGSGPVASSTGRPSATSVATGRSQAADAPGSAATDGNRVAVPEPAHMVVVVMENHSYADIIGNPAAPFINELGRRGALFTRSYAITHPSEPNYLALFSGSTRGVADDGCPYRFTGPNLAADLIKAGKTFAGYAEDIPGPASLQGPGRHRGRIHAVTRCPGCHRDADHEHLAAVSTRSARL